MTVEREKLFRMIRITQFNVWKISFFLLDNCQEIPLFFVIFLTIHKLENKNVVFFRAEQASRQAIEERMKMYLMFIIQYNFYETTTAVFHRTCEWTRNFSPNESFFLCLNRKSFSFFFSVFVKIFSFLSALRISNKTFFLVAWW